MVLIVGDEVIYSELSTLECKIFMQILPKGTLLPGEKRKSKRKLCIALRRRKKIKLPQEKRICFQGRKSSPFAINVCCPTLVATSFSLTAHYLSAGRLLGRLTKSHNLLKFWNIYFEKLHLKEHTAGNVCYLMPIANILQNITLS